MVYVLLVLHKLLQMSMRSHPVELDVCLFFVRSIVYFHTSFVRTAKALVRLRGCAVSPEPSLVAYVISTIISWAGSYKARVLCLMRWLKSIILPTLARPWKLKVSTYSPFLVSLCLTKKTPCPTGPCCKTSWAASRRLRVPWNHGYSCNKVSIPSSWWSAML